MLYIANWFTNGNQLAVFYAGMFKNRRQILETMELKADWNNFLLFILSVCIIKISFVTIYYYSGFWRQRRQLGSGPDPEKDIRGIFWKKRGYRDVFWIYCYIFGNYCISLSDLSRRLKRHSRWTSTNNTIYLYRIGS